MSVNVTARIRLALYIDINSGAPLNYKSMSSGDQHAAKMELLQSISGPLSLQYTGWWTALNVTVDNDYQNVEVAGTWPDETKKYLENTFAGVSSTWAGELGFVPAVGDPCPRQLCTKMPDCSHDCRHTYYVTKPSANPAIRIPWVVGPSAKGVTAQVLVFIEWSTPSFAGVQVMGGSQTSPAQTDHTHDGEAEAAAAAASGTG